MSCRCRAISSLFRSEGHFVFLANFRISARFRFYTRPPPDSQAASLLNKTRATKCDKMPPRSHEQAPKSNKTLLSFNDVSVRPAVQGWKLPVSTIAAKHHKKSSLQRECFGAIDFVKIAKESLYKANSLAGFLAKRDTPVATTLQRISSGGIHFVKQLRLSQKKMFQGSGTSPPLTEVSRALRARNAESLENVSRGSGRGTPKSLQKVSGNSLGSLWKLSKESFLDCSRDFSETFQGSRAGGPERHFRDFFWHFRPEGPKRPLLGAG